jgi:Ca-activated chloride channel homolog
VNFAFSSYSIWLLGIPVCLGILYLVFRRVAHIIDIWFGPEEYARSHPRLKLGLRAAGFVLLFFALMGPYWGQADTHAALASREVYLLLDLSASMNAQDVRPSRLKKARQELLRLLRRLEGDEVGLIIFTENAYVQCPLTRDHEALALFLKLAETDQFAQTGTQFRSALATALDRFSIQEAGPLDKVSRAIVLVSDGEDFGATYASLIERLRTAGVVVFTVGVGSREGAPVPVSSEAGETFKRYEDGTPAITRLQPESLGNMADAFGTTYRELAGEQDNLRSLADDINQLAATPVQASQRMVRNNRYQGFLFVSVMLLFASMFLMPIRKE